MITQAIECVRSDPGKNALALDRALTRVGLRSVTMVSSLTTTGKVTAERTLIQGNK